MIDNTAVSCSKQQDFFYAVRGKKWKSDPLRNRKQLAGDDSWMQKKF